MNIISINGIVVFSIVFSIIFMGSFPPPFMFVHFKLFTIARKVHRKRAESPRKENENKFEKYFDRRVYGLLPVLYYIILYKVSSLHLIFLRNVQTP